MCAGLNVVISQNTPHRSSRYWRKGAGHHDAFRSSCTGHVLVGDPFANYTTSLAGCGGGERVRGSFRAGNGRLSGRDRLCVIAEAHGGGRESGTLRLASSARGREIFRVIVFRFAVEASI